jgi:hypothetical protein
MIRIPRINPSVRRARALAPSLAQANLAAELHLDHPDEVRGAERAPVRAQVLEPVEPRLLGER